MAQIELMVSDQPIISYKKKNKNTKKHMDAIADEWEKTRVERKKGEKINLSEFLRKK